MARTATELAADLQAGGAADLDRRVLALIKGGALAGPWRDPRRIPWQPIHSKLGSDSALFWVAPLPVCIGSDDDFMFAPVSADTQQQIADMYGLVQPTTKLLDLCRAQGVQVNPCTQPADRADRLAKGYSPDMKDALASLRFTRETLARLAGRSGLPGLPFKGWMLTNRAEVPGQAYNYGFYTTGPTSADGPYRSTSGMVLWQQLSGRHNSRHWDYSQVGIYFSQSCTVNGRERRLSDVLLDPVFARLASDEGVLKTLRQPLLDQSGVIAPRPSQPSAAQLVFKRVLRLGSHDGVGERLVADVQLFLGCRPDGAFGPTTHGLSREFQRSVGLADDGVWGPKTYEAANRTLAVRAATNASLTVTTPQLTLVPPLPIPSALRVPTPLVAGFRQAKHYKAVTRKPTKIVLHTAEIGEITTGAEALVSACATSERVASWHYSSDCDSIWQSVLDEHVAYHAPGANHDGIGIEITGRARQTAADWRDDFSLSTLELTAWLVAGLCRKHGIPVKYVDEKGLLAGENGITTHHDVTQAFKRSSHTDPGAHFPMAEFVARVQQLLDQSVEPPARAA